MNRETLENSALFLGIDTATPWRTIGLWGGPNGPSRLQWQASRSHGRDLLPKVESFLQEEKVDLDEIQGIAVSAGPGSFTALRVGVSVAQGLGMGLNVPVVPIGSLESYPSLLADEASRATVLLPARNLEVFSQTFVREPGSEWRAEDTIRCLRIDSLPSALTDPGILIGPALLSHQKEIESVFGTGVAKINPEGCWADGSIIARIGWIKWMARPDGFPADRVEIDYHQSHGALTIEERRGGKQE